MAILTGITDNYVVPGSYVEIRFGMGPSGGNSGPNPILLIGNKTAAGDATVDTVVYGPSSNGPLLTEQDCISRFGTGSEIHRMYRRVVQINKTTPVYAIAAAESAGTNATLIMNVTVAVSAQGTIRLYVQDEYVDIPTTATDTLTTIAAAAAVAVNNKSFWAVTATSALGVLTLTSKNKGPRNNDLRARWFIVQGTPGYTLDTNVSTSFTSGATSDDWTNALATALPGFYYYNVSPSNATAGNTLTSLMNQVTTQAQPVTGIRQKVITAWVGTQSSGSTVAATLNNPRCEIYWSQSNEWTSGEIAAHAAAAEALFEGRSPSYNMDSFGNQPASQGYWFVPAPSTQTAWPGSAGTNTALNNGLTPVGVNPAGFGTYIVMRATTKHKNGASFDYRSRDSHITTVADAIANDLVAMMETRFRGGKKLAADLPPGALATDPSVIRPNIIRSGILQILNDYDNAGHLKNLATIKSSLQVYVDPTVPTRSDSYLQLQVVNLHHQACVLIDDTSSLTA